MGVYGLVRSKMNLRPSSSAGLPIEVNVWYISTQFFIPADNPRLRELPLVEAGANSIAETANSPFNSRERNPSTVARCRDERNRRGGDRRYLLSN